MPHLPCPGSAREWEERKAERLTEWEAACRGDNADLATRLGELQGGQAALLSGQAAAKHTMDSGFASLEEMKEMIQLLLANPKSLPRTTSSSSVGGGGGASGSFTPAHVWEVPPKELKKDRIIDPDDPDDIEYDKLGGGSQGAVYRGTFRGEAVAIKVMPLDTPDQVKSFEREVSILARFAHPNVCKFYGACTIAKKKQGELGLELLARSLHDAIYAPADAARLTLTQKESICVGVVDGMVFLHGERPKVSAGGRHCRRTARNACAAWCNRSRRHRHTTAWCCPHASCLPAAARLCSNAAFQRRLLFARHIAAPPRPRATHSSTVMEHAHPCTHRHRTPTSPPFATCLLLLGL